MAVKDGQDYIEDSIKSILSQSYVNIELIIINDGSADSTLDIIAGFNDPRIRVFSQKNRGVALSANRGLALARGKYIARQDHDDLSLDGRFLEQVSFLESNPNIGLVGTWASIWVGKYPSNRFHDHPTEPAIIAFSLIFNNPFVHSSCMFRRELIKEIGYYSPSLNIIPLDDYHFISRISHRTRIANIAKRLVIYREAEKSLTSQLRGEKSPQNFLNKLMLITEMNIRYWCGDKWPETDYKNFSKLIHAYRVDDSRKLDFDNMKKIAIYAASKISAEYDQFDLDHILASELENMRFRWFEDPGLAPMETKFANYIREHYILTKRKFSELVITQCVICKDWFKVKVKSFKRRLKVSDQEE